MSNAYPFTPQPQPRQDDRDQAGGSATSTTDKLIDHAEETTASLTRGAKEVVTSIDDKRRTVGVDTDKLSDLIADEINDRPIRALGIAMAVGFFVGIVAAR
ncbi:hypothetical protein [Bosea sp. PAMC 26642]|uniref:hypothetical protein n=1 Tax=Bosea sp. (strain PAMC 26642) TaxID=1792307 RepID=UPI0007705FD2|nr:hypothetical protein [Bosea sp. PAMC 26642]AMJ61067.1 hypothetical protein AXW83_12895 [Bosea sp. PAMC 26642]